MATFVAFYQDYESFSESELKSKNLSIINHFVLTKRKSFQRVHYLQNRFRKYIVAVVVALLVGQLLQTPEICGLNPVIGNFRLLPTALERRS